MTNSLAAVDPEVAGEWHDSKNGDVGPGGVVATTANVAWWRCSRDPRHEWRASVRERTRKKTACPFCAGRRVTETTSLASRRPALALEWHPTFNGHLTPEAISVGSNRLVWWSCEVNAAHSWRATVNNRASRASGCPYCFQQRGREGAEEARSAR